MEISDLTIGDWVYDDYGKPYKIKSIGLLGNTDELFVMLDYNDLYQLNYIEPIPLTAEILEKNGFVNCHTIGEKFELRFYLDKNKYQVISYYLSTIELSIKTDYSYSLSPTIYLLRIKYVHELQHALRLCGLNVLANNFNI